MEDYYYDDGYNDNYDYNQTAYDSVDNGSKDTSPGWMASLQKGLGVLVDTAVKVAPAALQFVNSGKGTPQPVTNGVVGPVLNKYPEPGQTPGLTPAKKNWLPWILGGLATVAVAAVVYIFARRK